MLFFMPVYRQPLKNEQKAFLQNEKLRCGMENKLLLMRAARPEAKVKL
jgi:hypothetical protein